MSAFSVTASELRKKAEDLTNLNSRLKNEIAVSYTHLDVYKRQQVGRSLGVHLILATQKPSGTVDDNIWSNSKFRLCLRVQDRQDSMDMLHKPDAAYLTQAGRCYLQVGNDELYELFQSGWSGASYDAELGNAKNVVAKMISETGKTGITGSHTKMKRKEEVLERWIIKLMGYAKEALEKTGRNMEKAVALIYQMMERDHVDYAVNDYNTRRLMDFTEPVSYTHLDVYKRQAPVLAFSG